MGKTNNRSGCFSDRGCGLGNNKMANIKKLNQNARKASKLRKEFREKYSKIAKKFNEVCLEMDSLLAEVAGEDK